MKDAIRLLRNAADDPRDVPGKRCMARRRLKWWILLPDGICCLVRPQSSWFAMMSLPSNWPAQQLGKANLPAAL